jgi:hypothetical protein
MSTTNSARPCINSWADLPAAIVKVEQAGAHGLAHLMRALNSGRIAFLPLLPETSAKKFKVWAAATRERPAVALIGDDDGVDRGPNGWPLGERAIRWASSVMLHCAGYEFAHYQGAIEAAQVLQRVLVIESNTTTGEAWSEAILRAPHNPARLLIWPREGLHPVQPSRETMQ